MKNLQLIIALSTLVFLISCSPEEQGITEKKSNRIPVEVLEIQASTFNHYIKVTGVVEPVNYAFISPEGSGQIKKIFVSEGQKVVKGQVLARLNTSVIEGQIAQVKSQLDLATITYEKQDELWNNKHVGSEIQFLQAKSQKESLESQLKAMKSQREMLIIKAPFSGVIDKINLKEGELASPGLKMIELVNLNKIKIKAEVSESLLPVINKGDSVLISFPTYEDINITAPIFRTGNMINPANRTFTIEIRIDNIADKLKPYMISILNINDYTLNNSISVPSIIVKKDFDKEFVFIAQTTDSNTVAKKVYIESGRSFKDRTLITKGLNVNDRVIVKGYNTVSTGVDVDILNR